MKTQISKNTKRVLSFVLAFALVLGSVFVANSGVTLKADAESTAATELTWDGTVATSFSDTEHNGTSWDDAIIISTPQELAYLAKGAGSKDATKGKYYKIADGIKAFNMNGMTDITSTSTATDVKSASTTGNNWSKTVNNSMPFCGLFDGNGITIYNIYCTNNWAAGLFPCINSTEITDLKVTIKNVTVTASYFAANSGQYTFGSGVIFGAHINSTNNQKIAVENCAALNSYVVGGLKNEDTACIRYGSIGGSIPWDTPYIKNCLIRGNKFVDNEGNDVVGAIIGQRGGSVDVTNTLVIDGAVNSSNTNQWDYFGRVYTTNTTDTSTGITSSVELSDITGAAAKTTLSGFDFSQTWWATTTTPQLRISHKYHNFTTTYVDETYHSEACDCGLVSADNSKHVYVDDNVNKISLCACGAQGVYADIWDGTAADSYKSGTGTETDPYIIDTPEQLYKMVRSNGVDESGNALYFKVANNVKSLYLNDTRNKTASEFATAAASGSLNNWSAGLTTKTDTGIKNNADKTQVTLTRYADSFKGHFDGNGVTIYGLYSSVTSNTTSFLPAVGFVPAMHGESVIKNVIFDYAYIYSNTAVAAVVTASLGNNTWHQDAIPEQDFYKDANATILNVAVRNATVIAAGSEKFESTDTYSHSAVAGIFAARCIEGAKFTIENCLYDGTSSTLSSTDSSVTDKVFAGIFTSMGSGTWNGIYLTNNISIGVDHFKNSKDGAGADKTYNVIIENSYTKENADNIVDTTPVFNWTAWNVDTDTLTAYGTPMPKVNDSWQTYNNNYYQDTINNSQKYKYSDDNFIPVGGYGDTQYANGEYKKWFTLEGSGTATDPYIINDEITLYQIIATGGADHGVPQYFKLGCDLDLHGSQWCTNTTVTNAAHTATYKYSAFVGTIDGDGHTISGLYSASADSSTEPQLAFIPVMAGGTVKNIRFANSYVYANSKAVIAASGTGTIEGCSVSDALGATNIASSGITVKNSYAGTTYYDANGAITTVTADFTGNNFSNATWYAGSTGKALLLSQALKMPCTDVDGDGLGYEYTANDLVALKQRLLRTSGYEHVYGDVSRNGKINATDLVILKKELSNSLELDKLDGFWANIKAGKFTIYYNETDNYDFARKLELYFEQVAGVTVPKTISAAPAGQDYAIILKIDSSLGENNYSVAYDIENAVLTFKGGSFTAVEQAVLDFVANSDANLGKVYTVASGTLSTEKQAITVSDTNYYYAWGDEFTSGDTYTVDGTTKTTVDYSKWTTRDKYNDDETSSEGQHMQNQRSATHTNYEAEQLNVVENGKLTLKRGYSTTESKFYQSGVYSLYSMLFKFGYVEAKCTVPVDGYSFTSLWLNGGAGHHNAQIDNSLYSKVYELNSAYNGKINYDASNLDTYKYKLPNTYWEFDIFETIQKPSSELSWGTYYATASEQFNLFFNAHKWVKNVKGTDDNGDTLYYNIDWGKYDKSAVSTITEESYATNKVNSDYKIDYENNKSYSDTINDYQTCLQYYNSAQISGKSYVEMIYGFEWKDGEVHYYAWSVNSDGSKGDMLYHKYIYFSAFDNAGEILDTIDNGYMYVLMENNMYSSSVHKKVFGSGTETDYLKTYTDALTDMTFDYVRVYQTADNRDIVTGETEAFNSNDRWTADVYK